MSSLYNMIFKKHTWLEVVRSLSKSISTYIYIKNKCTLLLVLVLLHCRWNTSPMFDISPFTGEISRPNVINTALKVCFFSFKSLHGILFLLRICFIKYFHVKWIVLRWQSDTQRNIEANSGAFGDTVVKSMKLHWNQEDTSSVADAFDIIVASDW